VPQRENLDHIAANPVEQMVSNARQQYAPNPDKLCVRCVSADLGSSTEQLERAR
jgi:hypothetical protein